MEDIAKIYGFPIRVDNENQIYEITNNCDYPQQTKDCLKLYQSIEIIYITEKKLLFPLDCIEWKVVIKPTQENIKKYFKPEGFALYIEEIKSRIIDTITFFKPQFYYAKNDELPTLILHFYKVNYQGKLSIKNPYELSNRFLIDYKDTSFITPDRKMNLKKNNIRYDWIMTLPHYPMELIKFNSDGELMEFIFQKLNNNTDVTE